MVVNITYCTYKAEDIYGSVSPGWEFWPFHVTKMKNLKPNSSSYEVVYQYLTVIFPHGLWAISGQLKLIRANLEVIMGIKGIF